MPSHPIDLPTAYGRLRVTLVTPGGEIGFAAFMRAVAPVGQTLVDMMEADYARRNKPASCSKGCAACCRQEIPISAPEALLLAEFASSLPEVQQRGIAERFALIRDRVRAGEAGEAGEAAGNDVSGGTATADVRARGLAWFRQGLACPFLENESCLAHQERPFPCRNHLAFSEARHCSDPETGRVRVMNLRFSLGTVMAILAGEFMGEDPLKLPLAALEDWVRLHPAYADRRFPSEALAGRFVALLEAFCLRSLPAVPV